MSSISSWAQGIIIAVIIGTIIEMLLPQNNNSKYVKVLIGIFVLFSIVAPVVAKISNNKIETNSIIDINEYDIQSLDTLTIEEQRDNQVYSLYKQNLEIDIQTKIQLKGFRTEDVNVEISKDDNYTIKKIQFTVIEKNEEYKNEKKVTSIVDNIESIKIGSDNKDKETVGILTQKEKNILKQYLYDVYQVNQENIIIL